MRPRFALRTPILILLVISSFAGQAYALSAGTILLADPNAAGGPAILEIDPNSGSVSVLSQGQQFVGVSGIAIGPSGEVYAADPDAAGGNGAIFRIDPATGSQQLLSSMGYFVDPTFLATAPNGVILAVDRGISTSGGIISIDPATGQQTVISLGGAPLGISTDASGNIIVCRFQRLEKLSPTGVLIWSSFVQGFVPTAPAIDASNRVFALGFEPATSNAKLFEYNPATGSGSIYFDESGHFVSPISLVSTPTQEFLVSDLNTRIVSRIHIDGSISLIAGPGPILYQPLQLAVYGVRNGVVSALSATWGRIKASYLR